MFLRKHAVRNNQVGYGTIEIILAITLVLAIGFAGYLVISAQSTKIIENSTGPSMPSEAVSKPEKENRSYLGIKEWGLRVPLIESVSDLTYTFTKSEIGEYVTFTFKRLQDIGICKTDIGVALSRSATNNQPPFTLDNPASFKKIGSEYYYQAFGSSPCYDTTIKVQDDLVKTINGGDMKGAITNTLDNLEAVPAM